MIIINVGCGKNIIKNAINIDYMRPFRFIRHPKIAYVLSCLGIISKEGCTMVKALQPVKEYIKYGKATNLPVKDNYADFLYSCHMMEHLSYSDAKVFLNEVKRVLKENGIFRLVLPDLRKYIGEYCDEHDADSFLKKTYLVFEKPFDLRLKIRYFLYGKGLDHHEYMYDADSAAKLLSYMGFQDIRILQPGETTIHPVTRVDLDLYERQNDSFYIECHK